MAAKKQRGRKKEVSCARAEGDQPRGMRRYFSGGICLDRLLTQRFALRELGVPFDFRRNAAV